MDLESAVRKLTRIERDTLLITMGGTLLSGMLTGSWEMMVGIFVGGHLMLANFHFLWRFTRRLLEKEAGNKVVSVAGIFFLFTMFLGVAALFLLVVKIPLIPFFLGTLALVISIIWNGFLML